MINGPIVKISSSFTQRVTNRERIGEREMEWVNKRYHQKEREMECVKRYPKQMELKCVIERFFFSC